MLSVWIRACIVTIVLAGPVFLLAGGCSGEPSAGERVSALRVDAPLEEPIWDRDRGVLLALTEDEPRIARVDPETGRTALSGRFEDAGENLAVSPDATGNAYLPQPGLDRVAVVDVESLRKVRTFEAGPSPARAATDVGSEILFALSEDGSTVTGVDLETFEPLPPVEGVRAGKEAELEGPERGLTPGFFVAGPEGIALYEERSTSIEEVDEIGIGARAVAGDPVKVTRVYVGEEGSDRLLAVALNPENEKLTVAAKKSLGEPVKYVGADEKRIYAATESKLVVLKTENVEGFGEDGFEIVDTIRYRRPLEREGLQSAPLSGLAVGSDRVYLTLSGEPYVLSVSKPDY